MSSEPHILVIEDDEATLRRIVQAVRDSDLNAEVFEAKDGAAGLQTVLTRSVDLALCDLNLPVLDGRNFLRAVRTRRDVDDLPVILMTGDDSVETKVRALDEGANDFLVKPCHERELLARLRTHLRIKSLRDELRRAAERVQELARTDELTGLYNRRFLSVFLEREFARAARYPDYGLGLLMVDVDHFKQVNDSRGHVMGDLVLRNLARRLKDSVRDGDIVARYGGEEFLVILVGVNEASARIVAERIRAATDGANLGAEDDPVDVTVSVGAAVYGSAHHSIDDLLQTADRALYRAKDEGRNRVVLAA